MSLLLNKIVDNLENATRAHFVSFGMKQENLWYFSEALGKASPKICT